LPLLGFFFGGGGNVLHIRTGLRQDVMEVVAQADEGEAFVQEFAYAGGAEEEEAQDHFVFAGFRDKLVGGGA